MIKNKKNVELTYSLILFVLGLLISIAQGSFFDNYDNHLLILTPIILPLIGMIFAVKSVIKDPKYWKLGGVIMFLLNLGLAAVIFVVYSFSYWQF